jgi:hypothetical protein
MVYKARQAEATARQVDLAVRTALNRTSSMNNLNLAQGIPDGNLSLDGFESDVTYRKLQPQLSAVTFNRNSMIRLPPPGGDPHGDPFMNEDVKYQSLSR